MNDWRDQANCKGLHGVMFPGRGDFGAIAQAKAVCAGCTVREPCLQYAIDNPADAKFGIWGMCGEKQIRAIKRQRRAS